MIFQTLSADFRSLKTKRFSMKEDENRIDSWLSQLYFCLMSNFGSYVKALRKASTHLTEEPYLLVERDRWRSDIVLVSYLVNIRDEGRVACKQRELGTGCRIMGGLFFICLILLWVGFMWVRNYDPYCLLCKPCRPIRQKSRTTRIVSRRDSTPPMMLAVLLWSQ